LGYPVLGGNKYRNLSLLPGGVSKIETINYAHGSWRCTANTEKYRPDFSSERASHVNKPENVKKKTENGKHWSQVPDTKTD
jgi:hypothetical protein